MKKFVKKILRPIAEWGRKIVYKLMRDVLQDQNMLKEELAKDIKRLEQDQKRCDKRLSEIEKQIDKAAERWTWERYQRLTKDYVALQEKLDKSIERWTWERYQRSTKDYVALQEKLDKSVERWTWERYQRSAKDVERWTWERYRRMEKKVSEIHRHIDFTYRDIMVAMERQLPWLPQSSIKLVTEFPIAYQSLDHKYPHGTVRDNTRYPRFIAKCEKLLSKNNLAYLDLGCSGGGMVLDAALRGHIAFGLEGSDSSLNALRAEWRLLGDRLKTCDITKPFRLENEDGKRQLFDVITAWEVLEHISEEDLPQLISNIWDHLQPGGLFVASIANWDDIDPESGINWHVTVHPYSWWKTQFENAGFSVCTELLEPIDLARGAYNPPLCYSEPATDFNAEKTFHIVVTK